MGSNRMDNNQGAKIILQNGHALISGLLTFNTVAKLRKSGDQLLRERDHLIFDLKSVTRCDSSAVTVLIAWTRLSRNKGKTVIFINLPRQLYEIAKVSRLDHLLPIS